MTNNQKGLSLVELLAGIVLLSLVTTLTTIILVQVFNNNDTAAEDINIKQQANILISGFERQFHETETKDICFEQPPGIVIGSGTSIYYEKNGQPNPVYLDDNNCLKDVMREYPYTVDLQVQSDSDNEQLTLETTLVKGGQIETAMEDNDQNDIVCPAKKPADYINLGDKPLPCNSVGNYIWNGKRSSCGRAVKVTGNLYITGKFDKDKYDFNVSENAYFAEKVELDEDNHVNSVINIGGNACFKNESDFEDTRVTIGGSVAFLKEIELDDSTLDIGGDAKFYDEFDDIDDSTITIGGNADFFRDFEVDDSNVSITGSATFYEEFDYEGDDKDGVNDSSKYLVSIGKDATFKDKMEFEEGTLTVSGLAKFLKGADKIQKSSVTLSSAIFDKKVELQKTTMFVNKDLTSTASEFLVKDKSTLNVLGISKFSTRPKKSDGSTICLKNGTASCVGS